MISLYDLPPEDANHLSCLFDQYGAEWRTVLSREIEHGLLPHTVKALNGKVKDGLLETISDSIFDPRFRPFYYSVTTKTHVLERGWVSPKGHPADEQLHSLPLPMLLEQCAELNGIRQSQGGADAWYNPERSTALAVRRVGIEKISFQMCQQANDILTILHNPDSSRSDLISKLQYGRVVAISECRNHWWTVSQLIRMCGGDVDKARKLGDELRRTDPLSAMNADTGYYYGSAIAIGPTIAFLGKELTKDYGGKNPLEIQSVLIALGALMQSDGDCRALARKVVYACLRMSPKIELLQAVAQCVSAGGGDLGDELEGVRLAEGRKIAMESIRSWGEGLEDSFEMMGLDIDPEAIRHILTSECLALQDQYPGPRPEKLGVPNFSM